MNNYEMDTMNTTHDNQFVISYELLCLLQWIVDHDTTKLKSMITKALKSGLKNDLRNIDATVAPTEEAMEDIQQSIVDFFGLLESLLIEAVNEQALQTATEKKLMNAIDHIDGTVCDIATVQTSIEKATSKMDENSQENPKELLFKELLKRWKPNKKNKLN